MDGGVLGVLFGVLGVLFGGLGVLVDVLDLLVGIVMRCICYILVCGMVYLVFSSTKSVDLCLHSLNILCLKQSLSSSLWFSALFRIYLLQQRIQSSNAKTPSCCWECLVRLSACRELVCVRPSPLNGRFCRLQCLPPSTEMHPLSAW